MNCRKGGVVGVAVILAIAGFTGFINFIAPNATGITYVSGIVYDGSGGPWNLSGSPYIVVGDILLPVGETLTIEPGVEVKFDGSYAIYVNGNFMVVGTIANQIIITSNSAFPSPGNWQHIYMNPTGYIEIQNTTISYGTDGLYIESSSNNIIINNEFSDNFNNGIQLYNSSFNIITNNTFTQNYWGIYTTMSSNNSIRNNIILNNDMDGVWLLTGSHYNTVIGNNFSMNGHNGIDVGSSQYNTIENNSMYYNGDSGISLWNASYNFVMNNVANENLWNGIRLDSSSHNNTIINNTASLNTLTQGIGLWSSNYNKIENNTALYNGYSGIVASNSSYNIFISNNASYSINYQGFSMWDAHYNVISNNSMFYNNNNGIYMNAATNNIITGNNASYNVNYNGFSVDEGSSYNLITNNTVIFNDNNGIGLWESSENIIENNVVLNNLNYDGIYLYFSDYVVIKNNTVFNNSIHGIRAENSNYTIIGNNTIINNVYDGINLYLSNYSLIDDNNIRNNFDGIEFSWSGNSTIRENRIINNSDDGISLISSNENIIVNNNITSNPWGLYAFDSNNNLIANNRIESNNIGFSFRVLSKYNRIHHNNFISNAIHAEDYGINYWNTSCEGNYWDNWTTPDLDGNGIVDIPYDVFGGSNKDFYPLTTPAVFNYIGPPTNISAKLEGSSLENVNITWSLSLDDGLCNCRIDNYAFYYSTTYDINGEGYEFLAEIPNGTGYFIHVNAGEGDPNSYFYFIQANDTLSYHISNETQVSKFTRNLSANPHLISIPLILENNTISYALQTVDYDIAWFYDGSSPDPWRSYNPSKKDNDLTTVDLTMGLWVNVINDSNLTVAGIVPKSTSIALNTGWNLMGYPSYLERNVTEALSAVAYDRVEGYDDKPPQYLKVLSDGDTMMIGYGYWVKVTANTVLLISF